MSKILSKYDNNLDKAWYDSSNIIYSECDDNDNALKTVRVTFKDGRTYQYNNVNVNDYLMFRESESQGKTFNSYLKQYECVKIENKNIEDINKELEELLHPSEECKVTLSENKLTIIDNEKNEHIYEIDEKYSDIFAQVFSILDVKFLIKNESI